MEYFLKRACSVIVRLVPPVASRITEGDGVRPFFALIFGMLLFASTVVQLRAQTITTIAGGGTGDNVSALDASFVQLRGIAIDSAGNIYVADRGDNRIKKITAATGIVTVVAGNGAAGFSGDGGLATQASITVSALAVDTVGNILIGSDDERIRRVNASTGVITTIAGTGNVTVAVSPDGTIATAARIGFVGLLALDSNGNICFATGTTFSIRKIFAVDGRISTFAGNGTVGDSGDGGLGSNAQLFPKAFAFDAVGNLYISDSLSDRIRKVAVGTGIISTIAGTGTTGFAGDGGLASKSILNTPSVITVDANGNIYFSDSNNHRVRRIDGASGIITSVLTNLNVDMLAADPAGTLFAGVNFFGTVIRLDVKAGTYVTAAGGGTCANNSSATNACLGTPLWVTTDRFENIYFSDAKYNRLSKISSATGQITTVAGTGQSGFGGDGGLATSALLSAPEGLIVDSIGSIYFSDGVNQRIRKIDAVTGLISTVAGSGPSGFGNGGFTQDTARSGTTSRLDRPQGIAVDKNDDIFFSDGCNRRIRKLTVKTGVLETIAGSGGTGCGAGAPLVFSGDGGPAKSASLWYPYGLSLDAAGNIYFVDTYNRIRKIDVATGNINTVLQSILANDNSLVMITDVKVDPQGNLLLAEIGNGIVRRVAIPSGSTSKVAGRGRQGFEVRGYSGDGGSALEALLSNPWGLALDSTGALYLADSGNGRIRKVSFAAPNYSDLWWAGPTENGWGMSIQQHGQIQLNVLFVYDIAGKPIWYVLPGGAWNADFTTYSGAIYLPTSAPLNNYDAAQFKVGAPVGNISINFTSNSTATLQYVINGISGQKIMQRQVFGRGDSPISVGEMWWGGKAQDGWGINITQQAGILFGAWYTYGVDGKASWYVMSDGAWTGNIYKGAFFSTVSSPWLGATYNPSQLQIVPAGTLTLNFSDANNATMTYAFTNGPFAGITQTKPIVRQPY